jgi:hypothetical protein
VHELGWEQPKTIKELLDIATRHASGDEAVGAVFIQGGSKAVSRGGWGTLAAAIDKGTRRSIKSNKRGQDGGPKELQSPPIAMRR